MSDPEKSERISNILIQKLKTQNDLNIDGDRLRALVIETMARARDRTNVGFSEIGANSILDAHRHGVRNPPDLMFDSLKVTDRIFKDLALPSRIFLNAEDFALRFERIADDCHRPNPENLFDDDYRQECYLKYLVLGALFASANRWIVAEQHAESAVKIIERARELRDPIKTLPARADEPSSNMSGREAYYLLAVVTRVRARGMQRYDDYLLWLGKARGCLEEDRRKGTGLGVPFIRFDCELLAIALGRYYHTRSELPDSPCDDLADDVFRCSRTLVEGRQTAVRDKYSADAIYEDNIDNLPISTRTSIATNLIQVAVIAAFRTSRNFVGAEVSPVSQYVLNNSLDLLVRDTNLLSELGRILKRENSIMAPNDPQIICSPLMLLYAVVGAMLSGDNVIWRPHNETEVDILFDKQQGSITQYDEWRFKMLRIFAKLLL